MSSGWFDCTEPSLTTSLQGKQGVQGAYVLVRCGLSKVCELPEGKFFYQKLCQFLLPDTTLFDCLISTNPKGNFQPGAMCIEWVTPGRNMRSGSASSSIVLQCQERVADFVVVNKNIYNIVGEIKPEPGGLNQSMEQMVGLLRKGQKVMLGLVANPMFVSPRVLRCSGDTFYFDDLQLSHPNHSHVYTRTHACA